MTIRIANCSGFYGDRVSAARELVSGGGIDVLTGDWLAELTMSVLAKGRERGSSQGFATTFLQQLREVLVPCAEQGIKIVSNAGGLDPAACAEEVRALAAELGVSVRVASVAGDDVTELVRSRLDDGWAAPHLQTGEGVGALGSRLVVANAYLGCWGIVEALAAGADVVVCGRVSDASPVVGAAAWRHGWARDDWDRLAGAVAAGHVIECGAQATGGNFSGFRDVEGIEDAGFPIAEIEEDGSATITKQDGTGGAVTVDTVTAQLLYEIDGPRYLSPDAVARFDTIALEQAGDDRVRMSGTRGEPAPDTLKTGLVCEAGWRSSVTFVLTGLDIEAKAELAERAVWARLPDGRDTYERVAVRLVRGDREDPATMEEAVSLLTIAVADPDRRAVARLSRAAVETGLSSYPGLHLTAPPSRGSAYSVFWPALLPVGDVPQRVTFEDRTWTVEPVVRDTTSGAVDPPSVARSGEGDEWRTAERLEAPLGAVTFARSGDKGANATLGVWTPRDGEYAWLEETLDEETLRRLLPRDASCEIRRWLLPNLRAVGFTLVGLLAPGVEGNLDLDAQGKGLGEFLRARHVPIPAPFLGAGDGAPAQVPAARSAGT